MQPSFSKHPQLFRAVCALAAALFLLSGTHALAFNPQPSQPQSATFYPNEVQLTVEESLRPENLPGGGRGFLIALPLSVVTDSLTVSLNGNPAGAFYWLSEEDKRTLLSNGGSQGLLDRAALPENERDPARKALLETYVQAREGVSRTRGELQALEKRLALWEKTLEVFGENASAESKAPLSPSEEAAKLDAAYAQNIPQLYADKENLQLALSDAEERYEWAERALAKYDNATDKYIAVVPLTGTDAGAQTLKYTYSLSASSSLSYRLNADTEKNEISIAQDALLSQSSGFTWDNVDLCISTIRRDTTLRPGELRPWQISMQPKAQPVPAPLMMMEADAAPMVQMAEAKLARPAAGAVARPMQEERGTFRLWSLGKQRVAHDTEVRLSLTADAYPVKFMYTLRPSLGNNKGFLTADVSLPKALELPPGMAAFSVNGALITRAPFSFNGDKGSIFFGTDPQVTATMRNLKRTSGQEGVFSKDDTILWHWEITLKNTRSRPVDVVLEDPMPNTTNTAISITTTSKPKPEEAANEPEKGGARFYRWKATLKPGEPLVIEHKVQATAPQNKDTVLSPGRDTR